MPADCASGTARWFCFVPLSVWIIGAGGTCEHVAEDSAVVDGDADTDFFVVSIYHGFQMAGRVFPIGDSFFSNAADACSDEDREIGTEAIWVSGIRNRFAFFAIVMRGVVTRGALLCCIHEGLVDYQFRDTVFPRAYV